MTEETQKEKKYVIQSSRTLIDDKEVHDEVIGILRKRIIVHIRKKFPNYIAYDDEEALNYLISQLAERMIQLSESDLED